MAGAPGEVRSGSKVCEEVFPRFAVRVHFNDTAPFR
jgi:hypothetical protein